MKRTAHLHYNGRDYVIAVDGVQHGTSHPTLHLAWRAADKDGLEVVDTHTTTGGVKKPEAKVTA
jgi:hypothetical protein